MSEGMPGVPVEVNLDGAREFTLLVSDASDGNDWDQADWANAKVVLADGRELWLSDLPVHDSERAAYATQLPFSFTYAGQSSRDLLKCWNLTRTTRELAGKGREYTLTWKDNQTGLVCRCVAIEYRDFPTVEWTLYFKNTDQQNTPVLSNIQALDTYLERGAVGEFTLHHHTGSICSAHDYQPHQTELGRNAVREITTSGGRPTNSNLPYFNIEWHGEGLIAVIGWPGQWAASFAREGDRGLRIRGGQALTHLKLHPGEEIRSPLIVLQFYKGDRLRSQNIWRQWMAAHNMPRPGGQLPSVQMAACSSHQYGEMLRANTDNQIMFINRYLAEGFQLDYWWMDAGWYVNNGHWGNTGTWKVDTNRFPGGLLPICNHAHAKGVKTIVWFEPERVSPGTWLYKERPEWLLGPDGQQKLLDLGNPEARKWLINHVDKIISEQGIDLYRQDFNIDPLSYWRANDAPDRQGITEICHVMGYLAYWDELRRRHPEMLIDSCASGGRRNDLETLRRAVPLLRSDYIMEPVGNQNHTYGISFWIPFYGTGTGRRVFDAYYLRSALCPHFTACFDMRLEDVDLDLARRELSWWRQWGRHLAGDYYPLTSYSLANDVWMAWQFDQSDLGQGVVQVFRRAESPYETGRFRLQGLRPDAGYFVKNLDENKAQRFDGSELMDAGLEVRLPASPAAAVLTYKVDR
jgi:alpha-galactosidase